VTPAVSIVIPTWNGLELLKRFLPSVIGSARHYHQHTQSPAEIIVVDDGSRDQTIEWLRSEGFVDQAAGENTTGLYLKFVSTESNRGFGEACNLGFASASHPLVFLINNDAEPALDAIRPLVENFEDETVFAGETRVDQIKRTFDDLVEHLFRSQMFPRGAMLLTGAGIVPPDAFTLAEGDRVRITISGIGVLENPVRIV